MKKLVAALFAATLMFSTVGSIVIISDPVTVEAKKYKSGKKGFNSNNNSTINKNNNSNFQQKQNTNTTNKSTATTGTKGGFMSGGLMKGLMLGGLAGLLFGGLLGNMGALGSVLGFAINIIAIVAVIAILWKIIKWAFGIGKKKKDEPNPWRS